MSVQHHHKHHSVIEPSDGFTGVVWCLHCDKQQVAYYGEDPNEWAATHLLHVHNIEIVR